MEFSFGQISEFLMVMILFFFSIVIHECAHGWVAEKCGDPTARLLGRITLNPIKHIDPVGTIILPVMLKLFGAPPFGWAKPVPVNFHNLRHPRKDMIWVAAAGPVSNIILASFAIAFLVFITRFAALLPGSMIALFSILHQLAIFFILINIILATFNMIPIPPLDGSRILSGLLPYDLAYKYSKLEPFGILIVFVLIYLNAFNWMFTFVQSFTFTIIRLFVGG